MNHSHSNSNSQQQQQCQLQQQQLRTVSTTASDSCSDTASGSRTVSTTSHSAASTASSAWDSPRIARLSNPWTPLSAPTPLRVLPPSASPRLSFSGTTSPLRFSQDASNSPSQGIPRSPQNLTRFDIKAASITGISPLPPAAKNLAQPHKHPLPTALPRASTHHAGTPARAGASQSQFRLFKPRIKFSATNSATTTAFETNAAGVASSKIAGMPRPSFSDPSLDYRLRFAKESGAYTRDASAASEILARIRFAFLNLRTRFNLKKHALAKAAATSSATTAVAASPWAYRVNTATSASTTGSTTRWSDVSATGLHGHHVASQGAESSSREGTVAGTSAVNTLGPSSYSSAPIHVRGTVESFERRWREAGSRRDTSYGGDLLDFSVNGSLPRS